MSALEKLAKMKVMVGYPGSFRDYSALKIDAGDLYGNVVRSFGLRMAVPALASLYKPVDRNSWAMNPQEVNAYNGSLENKIVFPAGILQAPIFDPDARSGCQLWLRSARSSAMRSATASTTRAARSTPPARCAIGGPPRTPSASRTEAAKYGAQYRQL